jgi:hypothetical protein
VGRPGKAHQRLTRPRGRAGLSRTGLCARAGGLATVPLACALLLGALLAGCGGGNAVQIMDDSGESWVARGDTCVRESEDGPTRRVINYVDPELCGRHVRHRSPVYVRVLPPPGMRSQ